jgi:hypothetical protein
MPDLKIKIDLSGKTKEKFSDIVFNLNDESFHTNSIYKYATDIFYKDANNSFASDGSFNIGLGIFVYVQYCYKSEKFGNIEILSHDIYFRYENNYEEIKETLQEKQISEKLIDDLIEDLKKNKDWSDF